MRTKAANKSPGTALPIIQNPQICLPCSPCVPQPLNLRWPCSHRTGSGHASSWGSLPSARSSSTHGPRAGPHERKHSLSPQRYTILIIIGLQDPRFHLGSQSLQEIYFSFPSIQFLMEKLIPVAAVQQWTRQSL